MGAGAVVVARTNDRITLVVFARQGRNVATSLSRGTFCDQVQSCGPLLTSLTIAITKECGERSLNEQGRRGASGS